MFKLSMNQWTSDLNIKSDISLNKNEIIGILDSIKSEFYDNPTIDKLSKIPNTYFVTSDFIEKFINYRNDGTIDYTGLLKGFAINEIHNLLCNLGSENHIIDFGGDILNYQNDHKVSKIKTDSYDIISNTSFLCFTSGNNEIRGNHIKVNFSDLDYDSVTYFNTDISDPIGADALSTHYYANGILGNKNIIYHNSKRNKGYLASPFFCDFDIIVRDNLQSKCYFDLVRPDLLNPIFENQGKSIDADRVFKDNIESINNVDSLIFPQFTTDLGTLMELGYAISKHKKILRYNYLLDNISYIFFDSSILESFDFDKYFSLDFTINPQYKAILFGYMVGNNIKPKYYLGNNPDNIMLSNIGVKLNHKPDFDFESDIINDNLEFVLGIDKSKSQSIVTSVS